MSTTATIRGTTFNLTFPLPEYPRADLAVDAGQLYAVDPAKWRNKSSAAIIATAGSGVLGIARGTFGTGDLYVTAGDCKTVTNTREATFEFVLPAEYKAAASVSIVAVAGMLTTVADGSCTLDAACHKSALDGTVGSDLVTTSAQTINSLTLAEKSFAVTSSGLAAGDKLEVCLSIAVADTATGTAVTPAIVRAGLRLNIQG